MKIAPTGYWYEEPCYGVSSALADWICDYLSADKSTPVHDLGCGAGYYLRRLREAGYTDLTGYEGSPVPWRQYGQVIAHDLTEPLVVAKPGHVVCLEVAEHVPRAYQGVLLTSIAGACAPGCKLVMSWAVRGQGGDGHVNCLDNWEAIDVVRRAGFEVRHGDSVAARLLDHGECAHFRATLMMFERV